MSYTMNLPIPPGNPAAVGAMSTQPASATGEASETSAHFTDSARAVESSWSGMAQQFYSLLAERVGKLINGSGAIALDFSQAL